MIRFALALIALAGGATRDTPATTPVKSSWPRWKPEPEYVLTAQEKCDLVRAILRTPARNYRGKSFFQFAYFDRLLGSRFVDVRVETHDAPPSGRRGRRRASVERTEAAFLTANEACSDAPFKVLDEADVRLPTPPAERIFLLYLEPKGPRRFVFLGAIGWFPKPAPPSPVVRYYAPQPGITGSVHWNSGAWVVELAEYWNRPLPERAQGAK